MTTNRKKKNSGDAAVMPADDSHEDIQKYDSNSESIC